MSAIFRQSHNRTTWAHKAQKLDWLTALLATHRAQPMAKQDAVYIALLHTHVRIMREKLYATR